MRRLLKELVEKGTISGNTATLEDANVIKELQSKLSKQNSSH